MTVNLSHFGLGIDVPFIGPSSRSFRPPSWPPPKNWVCIEDNDGKPVSRWGDPIWNLWPWCDGKGVTLNFGDGPKQRPNSPTIDQANADILRLLVTWRAWGPRAMKATSSLVSNTALPVRKIVALCSKHKILASDLSRYPALIDEVARSIPSSTFRVVLAELDFLRNAREVVGFELLDEAGIQRLKAAQPNHVTEQTEYIPPRIWTYVVNRTKECIDDYLAHQDKIEECFVYCIDAYKKNGAREQRIRTGSAHRNPFQKPYKGWIEGDSSITYLGPFVDTAKRFGITDIIDKWNTKALCDIGIKGFRSYFNIIKFAALCDVLSFTLMRVEECASIRANCLVWHVDPLYGRIPLIRGETTKTDTDPNALWITSPSIEPTIRALTSVAKMRASSAGRWEHDGSSHLFDTTMEPWGKSTKGGQRLARVSDLGSVVQNYGGLFNFDRLVITEEDLKIAKAVCPTLNQERFQVGKPWSLAWHQLRRTGAVNMFASGEISDSTMQLQMKHLSRLMPLYYGRGNSTLHLNEDARILLVNAQYEAMGRQLAEVHTDRFVSPYGDKHKAKLLAPANGGEPVNLISEGDAQHYEKSARKHLTNFRLTVLGGCMKNGQCDGDCVSSVGDCAGGDGEAPCVNVLFDCTRAPANQIRLKGVVKQMEATPPHAPLYRYLAKEKRGLENYFAYIRKAT